jgi:hypothetical protein
MCDGGRHAEMAQACGTCLGIHKYFQSDYKSASCNISGLVEGIYVNRITSVNVRNSSNCIYSHIQPKSAQCPDSTVTATVKPSIWWMWRALLLDVHDWRTLYTKPLIGTRFVCKLVM